MQNNEYSNSAISLFRLMLDLDWVQDKTKPVIFDFCRFIPNGIDVRRLNNNIIAIFGYTAYKPTKHLTCSNVINSIREAMNNSRNGLTEHSEVWVKNDGDVLSTAIISVKDTDNEVVLITEYFGGKK
jgi:hypothetical protein